MILYFNMITFVETLLDTKMNYRLQQFLAAENITQAQFADLIGVARASVSHIIAGRNKPGFDFIQNMSRHFPDLNLEWLINGKGKMYKEGRQKMITDLQTAEGQLFSYSSPSIQDSHEPTPAPTPEATVPVQQEIPSQNKLNIIERAVNDTQPKAMVKDTGRNITRVVVFYDDGTYQELKEA